MSHKFIEVLNRDLLGGAAVLRIQLFGVSVFSNTITDCIFRKSTLNLNEFKALSSFRIFDSDMMGQ